MSTGYATNLLRTLKLLDTDSEVDPLRHELNLRMVATLALMDRLLSFTLRLCPYLTMSEKPSRILGDYEFWALKRRTRAASHLPDDKLTQQILDLADLLYSVNGTTRLSDFTEGMQEFREMFEILANSRPESSSPTAENLERHRQSHTLRRFSYMSLLYHHVGQLIHFQSLKYGNTPGQGPSADVLQCYSHANAIIDMIEYTHANAGLDLHNFSVGQILTTATAVLVHALLMATSVEATHEVLHRVRAIRAYLGRGQRHTRIFSLVVRGDGHLPLSSCRC